ncbi:hypothetical protein ACFYTC_06945 [Actinomadura nitritigenes]|uniref:hypothetical protein n=1 Tax=Actinomadura nitritigenes TaxID=134602 RepID=UPI0036C5FC3A
MPHTNLTLRQVALHFGASNSAAHRVVDHLAPLLALAPVTGQHGPETVRIVNGMLVPVHDRTVTASSKNYRYSVNMQVVIDETPSWWSRSDVRRRATTAAAPSSAIQVPIPRAGVRTG